MVETIKKVTENAASRRKVPANAYETTNKVPENAYETTNKVPANAASRRKAYYGDRKATRRAGRATRAAARKKIRDKKSRITPTLVTLMDVAEDIRELVTVASESASDDVEEIKDDID